MKSIMKLAVVATLLMVLLFSAQPSIQQQEEQSPQPGEFLGHLITDLHSLGLIKSTSVERKQFDKNEMNTAVTNLARMVRYLLVLKGQGKDDEVNHWVDSLKMSKKFSRAVRMVRKLMRKIGEQQRANGQSPNYVVPVKGIIQTVMKKALEQMKSLIEQSATVAATASTPAVQQQQQQQPIVEEAVPIVQQQQPVAVESVPTPVPQVIPQVNPAQQTWSAVEKMAHKMVQVTAVPQQEGEEAEEAHLVWEAVEQIARKMSLVAAEQQQQPEQQSGIELADIAQG